LVAFFGHAKKATIKIFISIPNPHDMIIIVTPVIYDL
jgi:hypothetical protein